MIRISTLMRFVMIAALGMTLVPESAQAIRYKVYAPYVEKGEAEIENYGGYRFDYQDSNEYELRDTLAAGYGLTDWWMVELEGIFKKEPDRGMGLYAMEFVNKFEFAEKGIYPVDLGLYTAVEIHRESTKAHKFEAMLLAAKEYTHWRHRANLELAREFGENSGDKMEAEFAWQAFYKFPHFKAGVEYYADFGEIGEIGDVEDQTHLIGPVISHHIPGTPMEIAVGYLFGVTRGSPDGAIKWEMEWEF